MTWYVDEDFSWLEEKLANDSVPAADINGLNQNNLQTWENMKALLGSDEEPAKTFIEIVADVAAVEAKVQLHDPSIMRTILSNDPGDTAHDIAFTAGWEIDSSGLYRMGGSAWTKRGDAAWDEGNNAGALFSGADMAANTWYQVWKIRNDNDGSIDYGWDSLANGITNIPVGYSISRRIGYLRTNASANLKPFFQEGNHFSWKTSANDYTLANPGTNAVLAAVHGPPDTVCNVNFSIRNDGADSTFYGLMTSPYSNDIVPTYLINTVSSRGGTAGSSTNTVPIKLDSSSRVRYRLSASGANHHASFRVESWIDTGI